MEPNPSPIHNLFANLKPNQKIAIGLGLIIIIVLFALIASFISTNHSNTNDDPTSVTDIQGVTVSTEYNEEHSYTLDEYLPASEYEYVDVDGGYGVVEYWMIEENTAIEKGIVVSVDSCDVEKYTAAANEYLKSLQIDLSEYDITYQTHVGIAPCEIK